MSGAACNIEPSGRRRRAGAGVAALAVATAALLLLDARLPAPWWRLGLAPLLLFAFLCLFQAQAAT
jgi:hypothetical protein